MKIRKAKPSDAKNITKVELSSGYHKKKFNALPMIQDLFKDKYENIFVLEKKSKIIGYITLRNKNKTGEIGLLAVKKKFQGKGYGKLLVKHALNYSKKIKIKNIFLDVRKNNIKAIRLYKKFDFKKIKEYSKVINKKIIKKIKMEKKL
ncbi:MAG: GNAT family N-acetyltransferase [Candidatus Nanoarchaeia archaeon]